jgi:hypothetical protein
MLRAGAVLTVPENRVRRTRFSDLFAVNDDFT